MEAESDDIGYENGHLEGRKAEYSRTYLGPTPITLMKNRGQKFNLEVSMKKFGMISCFCFFFLIMTFPAYAQKFPNRPVKIVNPYAPGGGNGLLALAFQKPFGNALGTRVLWKRGTLLKNIKPSLWAGPSRVLEAENGT